MVLCVVRLTYLIFVIVSVYCSTYSCSYAQSQIRNNKILSLEKYEWYNISPYIYITSDPSSNLTPETLIARYNKNLRGTKTNSDIIKISNSKSSIWIVFNVYNNTANRNWVLDFGNALTGRMGMIKKIKVINYTDNQTFTYPNEQSTSKKLNKGNSTLNQFVGSAILLNIAPKKKTTFVLKIRAQDGFPLIFNLKLVPQHNYIHHLSNGSFGHIVSTILFMCICVFFAIAYYIRHNKSSLAIISYYMIIYAIFFNFSESIFSNGIITGTVLFIMYIASYLLLIMAIRSACNLKYIEKPIENIAIITIMVLIVIGALLYLLIVGASAVGTLLMSCLVSICMLSSVAIFAFSNKKSFTITLLFSVASILPVIAFITLALINADIISATSNLVASFWYIHLIQSLFFMASFFYTGIYLDKMEKQENLVRIRNEQSLAQLKKSKESADQARLVRVIEREREIMAELRKREVKRTEEMRIAKENADKANKDKSAFLAVVSHEIRTPMNGILGMVQLLQKTNLSKVQSDYVNTIHKSGDTMIALLNDILDFEKIESGNMTLEIINFDLYRLVNDVVILMSGHASQKNITLNTNINENNVPKVVSGDPTRLRQILLNLVNNAIKFTEEGEVTISIQRISYENQNMKDKIRISVKDTGIGIPEESIDKLFTPFAQAESNTTRKYGGTGLGLAISNRLVEAMGSRISVKSVVGQGTTFFFDLDIIIQNEQGQDKLVPDEHFINKERAQTARPLKILVTEDNEMNRKVLDGLLSQQGHTVYMASNGFEALDICRTHELDLILMDIQMDGIDGLETTRKLRMEQDSNIADIPVIALTGNVMLEDIERFFEAGMNGFLAKPIDSNKLSETLYNASIGKFENDHKSKNSDKEILENDNTAKEENKTEEILDIDLSSIDTGLAFDNKNYCVPNSKQKPEIFTKTDVSSSKEIDNKQLENDCNKGEITEIQRFLMKQKDEITQTVSQENSDTSYSNSIAPRKESESLKTDEHKTDELLDLIMLEQLLETLSKDQFLSLLEGFLNKASEIIEIIETLCDEENLATLGSRAHELKGLAGNFGMQLLSKEAGEVEKSARMSKKDEAIKIAVGLRNINTQTRDALNSWANKNAS